MGIWSDNAVSLRFPIPPKFFLITQLRGRFLAYLMRHIKVTNMEYLQYCNDLVGCRIEEQSDGARDTWQEAYVVSFDLGMLQAELLRIL